MCRNEVEKLRAAMIETSEESVAAAVTKDLERQTALAEVERLREELETARDREDRALKRAEEAEVSSTP